MEKFIKEDYLNIYRIRKGVNMAGVLYKYAFDENKKLVCVDNYDKKEDAGHSFRCPNCEAIMIAKPGNITF